MPRPAGRHADPFSRVGKPLPTSLARGVSIDVVKELPGHASIRSTELYLHPDADAQRSAVERLGPLSFGQAT